VWDICAITTRGFYNQMQMKLVWQKNLGNTKCNYPNNRMWNGWYAFRCCALLKSIWQANLKQQGQFESLYRNTHSPVFPSYSWAIHRYWGPSTKSCTDLHVYWICWSCWYWVGKAIWVSKDCMNKLILVFYIQLDGNSSETKRSSLWVTNCHFCREGLHNSYDNNHWSVLKK